MDRELLTSREVESLLRYSPGQATRLARQGKLPHILLPNGEIRFVEADIRRLLRWPSDPNAKKEVCP
jgi:predicted site-specific integrase-resolvase